MFIRRSDHPGDDPQRCVIPQSQERHRHNCSQPPFGIGFFIALQCRGHCGRERQVGIAPLGAMRGLDPALFWRRRDGLAAWSFPGNKPRCEVGGLAHPPSAAPRTPSSPAPRRAASPSPSCVTFPADLAIAAIDARTVPPFPFGPPPGFLIIVPGSRGGGLRASLAASGAERAPDRVGEGGGSSGGEVFVGRAGLRLLWSYDSA
jgi:hypothetical protein